MKKLLFVSTLLLAGSIASAQSTVAKKDVPAAVVKSYLSQNSKGAQDSVWSKETITVYRVHYIDDGKRYESQYFSDGRWIKTFTEITQAELPPNIISQLPDLYPGSSIKRAYIELNNDGKFYALDLMKNKDEITIYFTPGGKFFR